MVRKLVSGLAVAALTVALTVSAAGMAADEKTPTVKDIMKKSNGKTGLCAKCAEAAKAEKWEDAQKIAKELKELGEAMGKNKPPKGEQESWDKLTKKFKEQTAAIAEAAEKKDAKAHAEATKAYTGSCMACHSEHRPAKKKG